MTSFSYTYGGEEEHLEDKVGEECDNGEEAKLLDGWDESEEAHREDGHLRQQILRDVPAFPAESLGDADLDVQVGRSGDHGSRED